MRTTLVVHWLQIVGGIVLVVAAAWQLLAAKRARDRDAKKPPSGQGSDDRGIS